VELSRGLSFLFQRISDGRSTVRNSGTSIGGDSGNKISYRYNLIISMALGVLPANGSPR
jgi:hypothetical protein